jgi:putative membrane protein
MSWVRTATSLISFGFAIDKFSEGLKGSERNRTLAGTQSFSVVMICIGIVALIMAIVQHWRSWHRLKREFGRQEFSIALVLACLITGPGVLGLVAVLEY